MEMNRGDSYGPVRRGESHDSDDHQGSNCDNIDNLSGNNEENNILGMDIENAELHRKLNNFTKQLDESYLQLKQQTDKHEAFKLEVTKLKEEQEKKHEKMMIKQYKDMQQWTEERSANERELNMLLKKIDRKDSDVDKYKAQLAASERRCEEISIKMDNGESPYTVLDETRSVVQKLTKKVDKMTAELHQLVDTISQLRRYIAQFASHYKLAIEREAHINPQIVKFRVNLSYMNDLIAKLRNESQMLMPADHANLQQLLAMLEQNNPLDSSVSQGCTVYMPAEVHGQVMHNEQQLRDQQLPNATKQLGETQSQLDKTQLDETQFEKAMRESQAEMMIKNHKDKQQWTDERLAYEREINMQLKKIQQKDLDVDKFETQLVATETRYEDISMKIADQREMAQQTDLSNEAETRIIMERLTEQVRVMAAELHQQASTISQQKELLSRKMVDNREMAQQTEPQNVARIEQYTELQQWTDERMASEREVHRLIKIIEEKDLDLDKYKAQLAATEKRYEDISMKTTDEREMAQPTDFSNESETQVVMTAKLELQALTIRQQGAQLIRKMDDQREMAQQTESLSEANDENNEQILMEQLSELKQWTDERMANEREINRLLKYIDQKDLDLNMYKSLLVASEKRCEEISIKIVNQREMAQQTDLINEAEALIVVEKLSQRVGDMAAELCQQASSIKEQKEQLAFHCKAAIERDAHITPQIDKFKMNLSSMCALIIKLRNECQQLIPADSMVLQQLQRALEQNGPQIVEMLRMRIDFVKSDARPQAASAAFEERKSQAELLEPVPNAEERDE